MQEKKTLKFPYVDRITNRSVNNNNATMNTLNVRNLNWKKIDNFLSSIKSIETMFRAWKKQQRTDDYWRTIYHQKEDFHALDLDANHGNDDDDDHSQNLSSSFSFFHSSKKKKKIEILWKFKFKDSMNVSSETFLFFNIEWNFLPEKKSKVKIKNFNFDKIEIFFACLAFTHSTEEKNNSNIDSMFTNT